MPRKLLVGLVLVAIAGAAGYAAYQYLRKHPEVVKKLDPSDPQTRGTAAVVPPVRFTDVTATSGVTFTHTNGATTHKLLPETMGGGVAVIDYDGDDLPDLLFVNSRRWPGHAARVGAPPTLTLYRNKGNLAFEDVTAAAGLGVELYGMGVAVGDYDNDGKPDVFVSCVGKHRLFRNTGGKFEDATAKAGVGGAGSDLPDMPADEFLKVKAPIPFGASCTFLDYDGDGRLDLFVTHYVTWAPAIDLAAGATLTGAARTYQQPQQLDGAQCTLYRNVDGTRFEDVSLAAGVHVTDKEGTGPDARDRVVGKALGVIACDPDGDGWPDLVVANDTVRNFFFHNQPGPGGKRVYAEKGYPIGAAYADEGKPRGGMGIDWCEFAPARPAAVIANFANEPLTFLTRDRPNRLIFADAAQSMGLAGPSRGPLKFGVLFLDYDNDGRPDVIVNNGHIEPAIETIQASQRHAQPPLLFWNTGDHECYFEQAKAAAAGPDLFAPLVGRGCVSADLDGDGDLDLVLVANGGPARVLRNDAPATNRALRLDLRGNGTTSNRSAIGTVVTVEAGGRTLVREVAGARGYLSQPELVVHVGLGTAANADKVTIRWPGKDGGTGVFADLAPGRTHVLAQPAAR